MREDYTLRRNDMRTRQKIWDEREYKGQSDESLIIELLLDIRELMQEIKGK